MACSTSRVCAKVVGAQRRRSATQSDRGRRRKRNCLAYTAVTLAVALSGSPMPPPSADGARAMLTPAADTPSLEWVDCGDRFQCSSARVPLDYRDPRGQQLELAVIKLPAAEPDRRIGTLFINFGGPGQSGVNRLRARARWPWLFSEELRARFDLVSWDSRGVGRSAAARCFSTAAEQEDWLESSPQIPLDSSSERPFMDRWRDFAARCAERAAAILDHASSANTARDLELLRRALSEVKLSYYGLSYGTQVGAIYANLFPDRLRALVLDGSLDFDGNVNGHSADGSTMPLDSRQGLASAARQTLDAFFRDCLAAGPQCAFSRDDPQTKWSVLMRMPPVAIGRQQWTIAAIVNAALPQPTRYPALALALQQLIDTGRAEPQLLANLTGTESDHDPDPRDSQYLENYTEAFYAIQCSDSAVPRDPLRYSRVGAHAEQQDPGFGRLAAFDMAPCAYWLRRDVDRYTGPWNTRRSAKALIINTRYDPATPLEGAYAGAAQLGDARVIVVEGEGHTSMYVASRCAERIKREYLFTGEVPPPNIQCERDKSPFDP